MNRIIGVLATYAVPILGAALVAVAIAWAVQTWRIGNLQEDKALLKTQLDAAVGANQTNQATIEALVNAAKANADKYAETLHQQKLSVDQINRLEQELSERAGDDIEQIESTTDDCARQPLPPDIRMRLDPRRDRDGPLRTSDTGAAGSG